ncbi:MAG: stage 0 sporulation protein [Peptococcaceae bacterium BRH_c4a]|nr:MAG: stage 0 sporulation protein [Peptococcaceae bacterium BRH_c4a]
MSYCVVGIRFKKAGKIYYFDPGEMVFVVEEDVIVETARGIEYGEIVVGTADVPDEEVVAPLKKVLRKATDEDRKQLKENRDKETRAYQVGLDKIAAHGLPMKLVSVEQTFDGNKIIFYFTAEGRIDFRDLVKDLAAVFRTRIELRQIGVRDEAKMMGGLGCCGRELCCSTWLSDFASVSIRMAKDQNLSLNPTKISGICGRLMCCLKYENDTYELAREEFPEVGSRVVTPLGEGRVIGINIFKKTVAVELKESKAIKDFSSNEITPKGARGENDTPPGSNDQANGNKDARSCCRSCKNQETGSNAGGRKHQAEG